MTRSSKPTEIRMIPIEEINILNPRARNQRVFHEIASNIVQVGLKRPITVTPCKSGSPGKNYDLVCGQGRLEAFLACDQKEIPAIVIDADEQDTLIMSLVENLARRQHRALDLMQGIEILKKQGYEIPKIAQKTGLTKEYVTGVFTLMEKGEERLISAVEAGHIPISLAIKFAESPGDNQQALQEAYDNKLLRGKKLLLAKRMIEIRQRQGKSFRSGSRQKSRKISSQDILDAYQQEADRKMLTVKKAEATSQRLVFVVEALRRLFREEHFCTILRAEDLLTLPKPLSDLMDEKGRYHG